MVGVQYTKSKEVPVVSKQLSSLLGSNDEAVLDLDSICDTLDEAILVFVG